VSFLPFSRGSKKIFSRFFKESSWAIRTRVGLGFSFLIGLGTFYSSQLSLPWIEKVQKNLLEVTGSLSTFVHQGVANAKNWGEYLLYQGAWEERRRLESENAQLREQLNFLHSIREENTLLRKTLNVVPFFAEKKFVTAAVLTSPLKGWNRTFLIGAGAADGVKKGQPVVSFDGVIGRVFQASAHVARVMPLTHKDSRIPIKGSSSRVEGILAGNGSAYPVLIYLQENEPLSLSEIIVTSQYDGAFPPGYRVGRLEKNKKNQPQVVPFIPWNKLEIVQVITDLPAPYSEKTSAVVED
jgi:rod shape-determining protein MreC